MSVENSTLDSPTENNHTYKKEEIIRESVLSTAYEMNFFINCINFDRSNFQMQNVPAVTISMTIIILAKFYQTLSMLITLKCQLCGHSCTVFIHRVS